MTFYRRSTQPLRPELPPEPPNAKPSIAYYIIALVIVGVIVTFLHSCQNKSPEQMPGVLVAGSPQQENFNEFSPFVLSGFTITPVANYAIRARVLGVIEYDDETSVIVPVDLALGWGNMSDSSLLNQMTISQSDRWYHWRYERQPSVNNTYIIQHSSNNHIVPANASVLGILKLVRVNDIINITGYLIDIKLPGGRVQHTSQTRNDTGGGSCEIIWVETIKIENPGGV